MADQVANIIKEHGLQPGDNMKSVHGNDIANSSVLDERSFITQRKDYPTIFTVVRDHVITGEREEITFSQDALNQLGLYARDMNVFGKTM